MNQSKHNANSSEQEGMLRLAKQLAASGDAEAVARTIDPELVKKASTQQDPAVMRAILQQMLSTEEGKRLANKVRSAIGNG